MVGALTVLTDDVGLESLDLFRTLVKLMALLPTIFTPNMLHLTRIIGNNCKSFALFSLLNDRLNQCSPDIQLLLGIGCQEHMEGFLLFLIFELAIKLKQLPLEIPVVLLFRARPQYLDLALALFL